MNKKRKILWGGATASSQYEGGYNLGGKGLDTQDCRPYLKRTSNATTSTRLLTQDIIDEAKSCKEVGNYPFRQGSDGYHHIDEDIQLLKELGIDIYRFSISWARLYPHGDEEMPNEEGIRFYDHIFKKVHQAGMKIFLTMNHYAVPLYLVETYGGWTNNILVDFYLRFAKTVFEHWGEYIDYYLPFNEINAGYFSPYNGVGLDNPNENILTYIPKNMTILPNTSGATNAEEAVRIARISRKMGCGDFIKIEVISDTRYLLPDNEETIKATQILADEGFIVLPYMSPDLYAGRRLIEAGAAAVMPLGAPIGSNRGLKMKEMIQIMIDELDTNIIVDAGIGKPSQAMEAMEMGADAVLVNSAISSAQDPVKMANAFRLAVEGGRDAFLGKTGPVSTFANASSPLTGFLGNF